MRTHISKLISLKFPSDQLTIGTLRHRFPEQFDQPTGDDMSYFPFLLDTSAPGSVLRDRLFALLDAERQVALNAFVEAAGQSRTDWFQSPAEEFAELTKLYQEFGIAQGPEHARQLIRTLEQDAEALATNRTRS